jgi:hypothetical protein
MLRRKPGFKLARTPAHVPCPVQQHARTSDSFAMIPRKSMCLVAFCVLMPPRPLDLGHTSCCVLKFVWVAMARLVLWAGQLKPRDTLDAVLCVVRDWGMRHIWFLSISLWIPFAYAVPTCYNQWSIPTMKTQPVVDSNDENPTSGCTTSSFMNHVARRDFMHFVTNCLQFYLENAPSV